MKDSNLAFPTTGWRCGWSARSWESTAHLLVPAVMMWSLHVVVIDYLLGFWGMACSLWHSSTSPWPHLPGPFSSCSHRTTPRCCSSRRSWISWAPAPILTVHSELEVSSIGKVQENSVGYFVLYRQRQMKSTSFLSSNEPKGGSFINGGIIN